METGFASEYGQSPSFVSGDFGGVGAGDAAARRPNVEYAINDIDDVFRWEEIFELMSIERIDSFWSVMELPIQPEGQLRTIARGFLDKYRTMEKNMDEYRTAEEKEAEAVPLHALGDLIREVFQDIAMALDAEVASSIYRWGQEEFFFMREQARLAQGWVFLFWELRREEKDPRFVPLHLPSAKLDALTKTIREQLDFDPLHELLDQARELPPSPWKEDRLKTYDLPELYEPFSSVFIQVQYAHFKKIWREIDNTFTGEELNILLEWAKQQQRAMDSDDDIQLFSSLE